MIKDLETEIGYHFHNISLLQNALTHSSYANERWHNSLLSNERLEFLGDSILGMLVADYLYRNFPDRPEGELTRMRADMVCETTLAGVAEKIHLGEHLLHNADYKTQLQELVQQKKNQVLAYVLLDETGPDHDKHFAVAVTLNGAEVGRGDGRSKKRAEQEAARLAIEKLFPGVNA